MSTQEIIDVVDELADELNPPRVEREAERLEIPVRDLLLRVITEVEARLT